jgi:surfactin synthase thioesterase subunit
MLQTKDRFLAPFSGEYPGARQRLFCFPFAGAGASMFREWPGILPKGIHVVGIQLPGRENRIGEPPLRHLRSAAKTIATVLSRYRDLPFALFGHSVGALLVFEVARELRNSFSCAPIQVFLSGCGAPGSAKRNAPIHRLPDNLFVQELRRLGGTPEAILGNDEVMQLMLPMLRADFELSETHQYEEQAPLECPITVLGGLQDAEVRNSDLRGWQSETHASFNIRMFPGDHYFIRSCRTPVLRTIAGQLGFVHGARSLGDSA